MPVIQPLGSGDIFWSNVVLLCHADGTNGSTTFTDVSPLAHTLTATSATVTTTSPQFGTGSADLSSAAASRIDTGNATDFQFGAGEFTVEAWAYFTSAPGTANSVIVSTWGSPSGWYLGMSSGQLSFFYSTTGADFHAVQLSWTPTLNTWYHIAADRDASNTLRVYVNGAVLTSASAAATFYASPNDCWIGNDSSFGDHFLGHLDEIRVTKGAARYAGAFTAPSAPFPTVPYVGNTHWNTADSNCVLSNGYLTAAASGSLGWQAARTVFSTATGKYYWEYTFVDLTNNYCGIANAAFVLSNTINAAGCAVTTSTGAGTINGSSGPSAGASFTAGQVCGIAIDLNAQLLWWHNASTGSNWNNSSTANPATGTGGAAISFVGAGVAAYGLASSQNATSGHGAITLNAGDSAFTGAAPAGFSAGLPGSPPVSPPTGRAYMITASRAGIPSAAVWSTTTRSYMVPLSVALAEAAAPAPGGTGGASQARVLVMA